MSASDYIILAISQANCLLEGTKLLLGHHQTNDELQDLRFQIRTEFNLQGLQKIDSGVLPHFALALSLS